jgi:putative endonuclease
MFYLYIIYSASANKYYVGHSVDPWKRLIEHNTSPLQAILRNTVPGCLKAVFQCGTTKAEAMQIEKICQKTKEQKST